MGIEQSTNIPKKHVLDLSCKGITFIPYGYIKDKKCQRLILRRNKMQKLPTPMPKLRELIVSMNGLYILYPQMVSAILSYPNLEYLDLSSNRLTEFQLNLEEMANLKKLNLFSNKLREIKVSKTELIELDIGHNLFTEIPKLPSTLTTLIYDFNYLKTLDLMAPLLVKLSLVLVGIENIADNIQFPNLEYFNISKNRINEMPDLQKFTPKLIFLDVSDNYLEKFPSLPKTIEKLFINANKIDKIPDNIKDLTNLSYLDIAKNKIKHIPELPSSLEYICVEFNDIDTVAESYTPKLKQSFFAFSSIKEIPLFRNNIQKKYSFCNNKIREIDSSRLNNDFNYLNLSSNKIKEIPNDFFSISNKMTELFLNNNHIKSLSKLSSTVLTLIEISNNPIKVLPQLPLSVKQLYIGYCKLESLPDSLMNNINLEVLDAGGNSLTSIPKLKAIVTLNLSFNKFTEFPLIPCTIKNLYLSNNKIKTIPNEINFPYLEEFDLSSNKIKAFSTYYWNVPRLQYFKLSKNPINMEINPCEFSDLKLLDITLTNISLNNSFSVNQIYVSKYNIEQEQDPQIHYLSMNKWVSCSEMKGLRDRMEDSMIIRANIKGDVDVYAIFDGHGGNNTSVFCSTFITNYLKNEEMKFTPKSVAIMIHKLDDALNKQQYQDGSTLAIVLFNGEKMITAHVGDSRIIVLSETGDVSFSTIDHKPSNRVEFERIHYSGGRVENFRLHGILGPARSMGDFSIPGNIPEPEIHEYNVKNYDKWIVVGCDGVFDVCSNEYIGKLSLKTNDPFKFANIIRNQAFSNFSLDNISVITVNLQKRKLCDFESFEHLSDNTDDELIPDFTPSSPFLCENVIMSPKSPEHYLSLMTVNNPDDSSDSYSK